MLGQIILYLIPIIILFWLGFYRFEGARLSRRECFIQLPLLLHLFKDLQLHIRHHRIVTIAPLSMSPKYSTPTTVAKSLLITPSNFKPRH